MAAAMDHVNQMIASLEQDLGIGSNDPLPHLNADEKENEEPKVDKKEKKEKTRKEAKAKPAAAAAASPGDQAEVTKLDIRVGQIVNVWKHETAEKLYCEEIDVGEEVPRHIASGLVHHYSLEEMQNRRVLVLCNLKARNLVGFKSHGMVLCAAREKEGGGEKVAFVEPPINAKIGERIVFDGLDGEPFSPAQVEKKKVMEAVAPDMKTNAEGIAYWKEYVFMTSAGACSATDVPNGSIR